MKRGVSVILPCLNEEASVAAVLTRAEQALKQCNLPYELLLIDNGSEDHSAERAREAGARVIVESRRGYGSAIRRGFAEAQYDILVMADADGSYDLSRLGELLQPLLDHEADLVIGNRMDGLQPESMPLLHRHVGNPLLTRLVRWLFGRSDILDAHSGFRVIQRSCYEELGCISTGMEFASEMIVRAIQQKLRIRFLDIEYHPRIGESKLRTFRDGWRHLRFLLLHSPGMLLMVPGICFWIFSLVASAFLPEQAWALALGLFVINALSLQGISIAILARAYAHLSGFHPDRLMATLYRKYSFEGAAFGAALLLGVGFILTALLTVGDLAEQRPLLQIRGLTIAGMLLLNSSQVGLCAYLISIFALPRRQDPEHPRGDPDAAIQELP